jgi:hypothetical protein
MSAIEQGIPHLLGGVSQQPATLRDESEGEEQINGLSLISTGLGKRPASEHAAVLSATPSAAYDSVHTHLVARNSTDRYRIVLSNGDLKVFDAATGTEQTVTFPNGKAYLNTTDPARDLRCVTVGEYTYITNKTVVVARASTKSPDAKNEALLSIRAADFATKYTVTLDSTTIEYTTPNGADPSSRADIGTERIAGKLKDLIVAALPAFSVTQYGSTLYIKRTNLADFAISASDGLADQGIVAIKGSVQRFDDLPDRAKNGFIVEITGDPTNKFDNFYVKYNDNGSPNLAGVWEETVKPGTLTSLDASTMPHQLVRGAALLEGIVAGSIAAPPVIGLGPEATLTDNWEYRGPLNIATTLELAVLDEETEEVNSCLGALDGTSAKVRAYFDVTAGLIKSGHYITIEMWLSNAPSLTQVPFSTGAYTKVAERQYEKGNALYDEYLEATTTLPANTRVLLMLRYSDATTPSNVFRAYVGLRANNTSKKHIEIIKSVGREVRFDPNGLFPTSCITTLTVGATPYAHTSTSDETGAQVAAALQALVGAPYTATVSDGTITITQSGSGAPVCSVAFTFNSSTVLYSPDLNLIANQLVGDTVENTSDGSTGTVTSNTATTIVVGALTGGAANKFVRGDVCNVLVAGTSYVFSNALWKPRKVGSIETIPFPSIVGKKIGELFFHKDRLGLAAQGNVVLSQAADSLNLFRQTATKLLADDVIDVKSKAQADFHSALLWDKTLVLWSSDAQSVLDGDPLTPETVGLPQVTHFINSTRLRPVVAGNRIFFARSSASGKSTQVFDYSVMPQSDTVDAGDITKTVATYLAGKPIAMAADPSYGFLAVLTDADQSKLYIRTYHHEEQKLVQNSWSRWEFSPGTRIVSIDCLDGKLTMLVSRPQGVYLETIDLDLSAV